MPNTLSLANEYYLHQVDYPEKIHLLPGHTINNHVIYDVTHLEQPNSLTQIFYISKEKNALSKDERPAFHQATNILDELKKNHEIIFCNERSLCALFFYFRRFNHSNAFLHKPIIIVESSQLLPFHAIPSKIIVPQLPNHVIASVPYFEDLNIPSRIASCTLDRPGWYHGDLREFLTKTHQKFYSL